MNILSSHENNEQNWKMRVQEILLLNITFLILLLMKLPRLIIHAMLMFSDFVDNEFGEDKIYNNGVKNCINFGFILWYYQEIGIKCLIFFPQNFLTCNDDETVYNLAWKKWQQKPILLGLAATIQYNWDLIARKLYIHTTEIYLYRFKCICVRQKNSVGSGSWHINENALNQQRNVVCVCVFLGFSLIFFLHSHKTKQFNSLKVASNLWICIMYCIELYWWYWRLLGVFCIKDPLWKKSCSTQNVVVIQTLLMHPGILPAQLRYADKNLTMNCFYKLIGILFVACMRNIFIRTDAYDRNSVPVRGKQNVKKCKLQTRWNNAVNRMIIDIYWARHTMWRDRQQRQHQQQMHTCERVYDKSVEMAKLIGRHDKSIPMKKEMHIFNRNSKNNSWPFMHTHTYYTKPLVYNCSAYNLNWNGSKQQIFVPSFLLLFSVSIFPPSIYCTCTTCSFNKNIYVYGGCECRIILYIAAIWEFALCSFCFVSSASSLLFRQNPICLFDEL